MRLPLPKVNNPAANSGGIHPRSTRQGIEMHPYTNSRISKGSSANTLPPALFCSSFVRNPHVTQMQSIPVLAAVAISTSESPTYTAFSLLLPNARKASITVSGAGFLRIPSFSPMATST